MAAISGGGPLRRSGRLKVLSPSNNGNSEAGVSAQAASDSAGRIVSGNARLSKAETRETRYARRNRASEAEDSSLNESARDGHVREVKPPTKSGDPNPAQSGTPTKNKVLSPSRFGTPTKNKALSPRNVGTPTKGKGSNLRMAETQTKSKGPSPRKVGIPNEHERASPIKSGASRISKAHSPIKDKGLSPVRDGSPNNAPRSVNSKNKAPSPTNVQSPIKGNAPSPIKSPMNENLQSPAKASSPLKAGTPIKGKASTPLKAGSPVKGKASTPLKAVSPFKDKASSPLKAGSPVKGQVLSPLKAGSPCKTSPMNAKCTSKRKAQSPSRGASDSKKKVLSPEEEEPFSKEKTSTRINLGKGTLPSPVKSGFTNKRKAASLTDNGSPSKRKAPSPAETGCVGLSKVATATGIGLDSGTKLQNHIEAGPVTEAKAQCIAEVYSSKDHMGFQEASTKHGAQSPGKQRLSNNVQDLFGIEHSDGQKVQVPNEGRIHGFSESDPSSKCESGLSVSSRVKDSSESGPSKESRAQDPSELGLSRETRSGVHGTPSSVRDPRIRCCSKQIVQEVLAKCNEFSKEVMESQQHVSLERREQDLRNCIWDFEKAFQENITINGEAWHEAPETQNEPDIKILEDKLDDAIVDTAMKRKRYPRKILSHVVKMLKTEREILAQTKPAVQPEEIKFDSQQASRMVDLTTVTTNLSKHISETMKALPAQIEKAKGFSHVLSLQPILENSRTRKEIFCTQVKLVDLAKKLPRPLETTPRDTEAKMNVSPVLSRRRQTSQSPNKKLYPLRSKRKISLSS
ncbi:flocculation protein FLO11 isoform X2 [Xenopus laevis]|uniref:Flocculation protein FLO11 isoform X2 n=1 Tax=Xenopus laevis TaxID=8355 RepID=A0A8J1KTV8_XENLA|nr:flocculation protein FLO11 isoform X2 [Xenopus laevis]